MQANVVEQSRNSVPRLGGDAKANGSPLTRQCEKVGHRDRQRAVDVKRLRHIRNAAALLPMDADLSFEGNDPENREQQRGFAGTVRPHDGVEGAALYGERKIREKRQLRRTQRQIRNFE